MLRRYVFTEIYVAIVAERKMNFPTSGVQMQSDLAVHCSHIDFLLTLKEPITTATDILIYFNDTHEL